MLFCATAVSFFAKIYSPINGVDTKHVSLWCLRRCVFSRSIRLLLTTVWRRLGGDTPPHFTSASLQHINVRHGSACHGAKWIMAMNSGGSKIGEIKYRLGARLHSNYFNWHTHLPAVCIITEGREQAGHIIRIFIIWFNVKDCWGCGEKKKKTPSSPLALRTSVFETQLQFAHY